ncbi:MarR family winged helix-turn-helix transcriptional regulator [Actinocorallia longicatena]|uniref:MarR family winged helix-turn-helix transcriptional regulator n=1 Tax=Actinocorallia longicatena TaxID=111803 RepID=A0ABP6Q7M9_9ACTN
MPESEDPSSGEPTLRDFAVRLRRMVSQMERVAHGFAHEQGLHPTDLRALIAVLDAPDDLPMTHGRLREELNVTSGAVTACVDRLEHAGHIRRVRDPHDRRVVHLHYEDAARNVAGAAFRPLAESTRAALEDLSPAERTAVVKFLDAMNDQLTRNI